MGHIRVVSAAETAWHELTQRSEVGVALVARDANEAERMLEEVIRIAEREDELVVLAWHPQVLEEEA